MTATLLCATALSVAAPRPSTTAVAGVVSPAGANRIEIVSDESGFKLHVDGRDMMIFGMNWSYVPIGENYTYSLWSQPDDVIEEALRREMTLLRDMGVNVIRQHVGVPARWIAYIYEEYGIYTLLNHTMGRYGANVDGVWIANTDYGDERTRQVIRDEIELLVEEYKGVPGLLMWLLGNENNYALAWTNGQIEDLPIEEANQARAGQLYSLFGEIAAAIKARDPHHPVTMANGDLQYIDLVAKHCGSIDVFGANVYRGESARDLFDVVAARLDKPFVFTELGADAYDARARREDQVAQARYLRSQWQEIYEQSYGKGRAGNAIGGVTFQWSDGWWKHLQEERLDIHDTTASWANGGYPGDFVVGDNNMNEEWFGICAKGRPDERGLYDVYPRAAYYVLQRGFSLDPYDESTTLDRIREHWGGVDPSALAQPYELASALDRLRQLDVARVANLRLQMETYTTDGRKLTDPSRREQRFDHLESFYVDLESRPLPNVAAEVSVNILGHVPANPIDEIFYESRGEPVTVTETVDGEPATFEDIERIKIYGASLEWDSTWFRLEGFFRRGHYHWGYEGDFFGLYPEAYYGKAIDLYDAAAPLGMQVSGKRALEGLDLVFGPELYWGANPMVMGKYHTKLSVPGIEVALIHQEEIAQRAADAAVSTVVPALRSRRTSVYLARQLGPVKLELGGFMSGTPLIDRPFIRAEPAADPASSYLGSGYDVADDRVHFIDTLGAKAKVTVTAGRINWYAQGAYKGVVADGGPDNTLTFTGWQLKESGRGNHYSALTGATVGIADLQVGPNLIYQKPLVAPLPSIPDYFDAATGDYFAGTRPRNILDDPFVVRGNQEMLGAELMFVYDPTPATFFWAFDNDRREDAWLAGSINFVWRDYRQSQDAGIGVLATGGLFAFESAPPPEDLWEINVRLMSNPIAHLRVRGDLYASRSQSRGSDERIVERYGASVRATYQRWAAAGSVKIDDWGPYDYHRDFNLTFPLQLMSDVSYGAALPSWLGEAYSRFGVRAKWRSLDRYSPRFRPGLQPERQGREWEINTYLHVTM